MIARVFALHPRGALPQGGRLWAAGTNSTVSAAASHRPTFSFRAQHHRRATAGRPYSEPGTLRMRQSPAMDLPRIARDVEDAVPYEINLAKPKKRTRP